MKYYVNTLNRYRLPAANANAMQLQTPDMWNSQNRNLCISAKIPLYRTYVALSTVLPRGLWFCVSLQCGHAIKTKLNASNTLGNRCSLHCSTPAVGGKNKKKITAIAQ